MIKKFLPIAILFALPALAANIDDPSDADSWLDVTVLTAKVDASLTMKSFDQVENCNKVSDKTVNNGRAGIHHYESFDCSDYISGKMNAGILMQLPTWNFDNGQLDGSRLSDPILVVETVVPQDRLALADAFVFSASGYTNSIKANGSEAKTHEARKVTLKDGRVGVVHRWIAAFQANGHSSFIIRGLTFKPALVRYANGNTYRYWDSLQPKGFWTDYTIQNFKYTGVPGPNYMIQIEPNSVDRTAEVLK